MPLFGPPDVQKLKAKADVKELIKALRYKKDADVRRAAADALGEIADPHAVEPLIAALEDKDDVVYKAAAGALGRIRDARAVEPLYKALRHRRKAAAGVQGQIRDAQAERSLHEILHHDPNADVKAAAARALGEIGEPALQRLVDAFNSGFPTTHHATAPLAKIGAPAVQPLIDALKHAYMFQQHSIGGHPATKALVQIGAPAVQPLIATLEDESSRVRTEAAFALGQIGDPRAVEPLIAGLKEFHMRRTVVIALGQIGDSRAVEPLIAALKDKSWGGIHHNLIATALGEIRDPRAVKPLKAAVKIKDPRVRRSAYLAGAAASALDKLGWKPDRTQAAAAYWVVKRQWDKCVEIGAPAVKPLLVALKHKDKVTRQAVAEALGKIGMPAVEPLIAALKGSDRTMREGVAEALGKIGAPAVEPLIAALEDRHVQATVAIALGQISDPRAVEPLIAVLKDRSWPVYHEIFATALKVITGEDFGLDAAAWQEWWEEQR